MGENKLTNCVFHCHMYTICSRRKGNFTPYPKSAGRAWKRMEAVAFEEKRMLIFLEELKALGLEGNRGLQVSTVTKAQDVANVQFRRRCQVKQVTMRALKHQNQVLQFIIIFIPSSTEQDPLRCKRIYLSGQEKTLHPIFLSSLIKVCPLQIISLPGLCVLYSPLASVFAPPQWHREQDCSEYHHPGFLCSLSCAVPTLCLIPGLQTKGTHSELPGCLGLPHCMFLLIHLSQLLFIKF